jgi:WD40 repeat protein
MVLRLENLWRGIGPMCHPSPTLLMAGTSSLIVGPHDSDLGYRLVLQLANLWKGIVPKCRPWPTLPMGGASSLDPMTAPFESGMPRLVTAVGKPLEGHSDYVLSVAYSPDGRIHHLWISVTSTIRMWDADTGAAVGKPLKGHSNSV